MESKKQKIILELDPLDVQRIIRIALDDDRDEALAFLKECLDKKVRDRLRPHCVPVFEVNYNPRQRDAFKKKSSW
ncbi:MAG: hypothetical protein JRI34_03570 [Deltaproteobacteria bacterium]|nr:hypothetical protein [Deltaproteobacteria bacterium]